METQYYFSFDSFIRNNIVKLIKRKGHRVEYGGMKDCKKMK